MRCIQDTQGRVSEALGAANSSQATQLAMQGGQMLMVRGGLKDPSHVTECGFVGIGRVRTH